MDSNDTVFNVLLIDDDVTEKTMVESILSVLTNANFQIDHVFKCSQALTLLNKQSYELVLLDDRLSRRISAKFSVPIIKSAIKQSPIAIISNDLSSPHLQDPAELGVDHIVNKSDMVKFLTSQLEYLLGHLPTSPTRSRPV